MATAACERQPVVLSDVVHVAVVGEVAAVVVVVVVVVVGRRVVDIIGGL